MAQRFDRRVVLKGAAAGIAAPYLWLPASAEEPAWPTQTVGPFVEVETAYGRIKGGHSRGALAFKAIPYGGPVSGKNRFKAPTKPAGWTGVKDCTRLGPPALQSPHSTYGEHEPAYSEDCLVLNVWTPAVGDGGKRAVMFYCHGGGYTSGSGGQNIQDGSHLAAQYDVVVVALNHRLGLFGFLYLGDLLGEDYAASGNQGLLDIVAALGWVKENIAAFGGDPGNVMVFGESGGGYKTSMLLGMPAAHGLMHKAGIQSGPGLRAQTKDVATETACRVLAALGIAPGEARKLTDVPGETLLKIQLLGGNGPLGLATKDWQATHKQPIAPAEADSDLIPGKFAPVVDGTVLPRNPFDPAAPALSAEVPLLIGNTRDEAVFFRRDDPGFFHADEAALTGLGRSFLGADFDKILALYKTTRPNATAPELGIAIMTALAFGNDTVTLADRKSRQPAPVYRYRYDYQSNLPVKGTDWTFRSGHASDIAMAFRNQDLPGLHGNGAGVNEAAAAMSGYFASFAKHGVPAAAGQPVWPRYDTETRATMLIDTACRVANDPDAAERRFWQEKTGAG